ncbi:MAG: acyltransferase [Clostridia bacterium]|nr:acyltransferase [Clostridia bacterium]
MRVSLRNQKFNFGENCFDLLRLLSALHVMTQHIFRHVAHIETSAAFNWWSGVVVLFCISGFLIPASMERSKGVGEFLKKRVFRIIPSLWICIIVGVVVAAAFCGFVYNETFLHWFLGQLCFIRDFPQPDFISSFGVGNFQGSLWTMIYTVQFYIITAFIYRLLKNRKIGVWIAVWVFSLALNLVTPHIQSIVSVEVKNIISHTCLPFFYIYFTGWFIYRWREKIVPFLSRIKILLILLIIARGIWIMHGAVRIGEYQDMIIVLLLVMLTIGAGYSFGKLRFKIDLSYGLYLYHMIVVDVFVQMGWTDEIWYVLGVYAVSAVVAFVSYYLVDDTIAKLTKGKKQKKQPPKAPVPPKAPPQPARVPAVSIAADESDF